ncbi:MAG: archaetidylserine decarboxylase [Planctomycetota bacterium]
MSTPLRLRLSHLAGWFADRSIPRFLRPSIYKTYCALTGAEWREARSPLTEYPSLGQFFVRELAPGLRPIEPDLGRIPCPVDGTVQDISPIEAGTILQAKGHRYGVRELLAGVDEGVELEGGTAWTIYLGPKDYHRIHSPVAGRVTHARWTLGSRYSVQPRVLARRMVLPVNERCVLRFETDRGPLFLVLVGAVIVGRIRVVGIEPDGDRRPNPPREVERGGELARFEMGSTIVLVTPPGMAAADLGLQQGSVVRMGQAIGTWGKPA